MPIIFDTEFIYLFLICQILWDFWKYKNHATAELIKMVQY